MSKNLIVVESPAKAKTIKKYLGKDFEVLATYGHVRDLVPKNGAVDPENHFAMRYEIIEKNLKHVEAIVKAVKQVDALYLATDPDREGEAISWHLYELLKEKKVLKNKPIYRVVFYEVTKNAVNQAVNNPKMISMDLVNAQQGRRALDYLVGFNLSPLLWKKIRRGLSAGRVQSPALRMIVEREEEIERFEPKEYWTIDADIISKKHSFLAKLAEYNKQKITQFSVTEASQAESIRTDLLKVASKKLTVTEVEKKQRKRQPAMPFITSTLQQEAVNKLGFTTKRTMRIAQQLYEGIDVGNGAVGLITYMRTDSVNLAAEAINEIRTVINARYGADNLPDKPRVYQTKSKNAQEAHEAIRPTSASLFPEAIRHALNEEQYKLYNLIWQRTVASQMIHATIDMVSIDFSAAIDHHRFRATGSTIANPGFLTVYEETAHEKASQETESLLPVLAKGDEVDLQDIKIKQHFTEPPARYSEAGLVKALEEYGIGRPSTYSSIISTLEQREYVMIDKKRFYPTDVGRIVNRFLTQHFAKYVEYEFTAKLEDDLDAISRGEGAWVPLLEKFWEPFKSQIDHATETVNRADVTSESLDEACPDCGKPLSIRLGKRGRFVGCTAYPECNYTRNLGEDKGSTEEAPVIEGRNCPGCGSALHLKQGRYGKFIGCSNYPTCKHIEPLEKPADMGVQCPECHKSNLLQRKSRYGKIFYSCASYPECKYALWHQPIDGPCPICSWPILSIRITKRRGTEKACPQKGCKFAEQIAPPGEE